MLSLTAGERRGPASLKTMGRHKHSLLLATLVTLLLASPLLESDGPGGLVLSGLFSLLMVVGTLVVGRGRRDLAVILTLSIAWLYLTWLHPVWSGGLLDDLAAGLLALVILYMTAVLLLSILSAERVTHDVISGAIAVYLLMGIGWSVVYALIEGISPGSFGLDRTGGGSIWEQLLYFSFTTLTTLGYGDIAPLTPLARIWTVFEAICGTFFLAILISRLVSLYQSAPRQAD